MHDDGRLYSHILNKFHALHSGSVTVQELSSKAVFVEIPTDFSAVTWVMALVMFHRSTHAKFSPPPWVADD